MRLLWRTMPVVALLLVGAAANAQPLGGPGGGRGRDGGVAGGAQSSGDRPPPPPAIKPFTASQIDMVGVVKEVGPNDRITIEYEAAPALTLPAGIRQFVVAKTSLLKDVTVGEQVRFRLDSQEVSVLAPFDGDRSKLFDGMENKGAGGGRGSGRGGPGGGF